MATLPPRKNPTPTRTLKEYLSPLETLLQLGFPKHRAEKALAATGHRGVQLASDWLLAHVRDPTLDSCMQRQYVLYVCPTGLLAEQLSLFWQESKSLGWNGAHNLIPHVTLVPFFNAPDGCANDLSAALERITSRQQQERPKQIELESYVSPNFMGLFIKDKHAEWLKDIAVTYANELTNFNVTAEPQTKSLHLTLAYQFTSNLFQSLRSMVDQLCPNTPANWEIRLYSRDCRLQNCQVRKVIHAHMPKEHDELELRVGDYIYVPDGACETSADGWVEGVSWLTGMSGHLPMNYTERTADSDSWTLHSTVQLTRCKHENVQTDDMTKHRKLSILSSIDSVDVPDGLLPPSNNSEQPMEGSRSPTMPSREILICRHGERVDFTFGAWIPYCFEANGTYIRRDLNMPKDLPSRNIHDYQHDSPLTTFGEVQARLVGEAMKSSSVKIHLAFTSPSLRCVQTLAHILKGLDSDVPMKVEPGLIEWLAWYPNGVPIWMTTEELVKAGFNIDSGYSPIVESTELPLKESAAQYYERSYGLIRRIIDGTLGNILIVAHAASLAACTKQLIGGRLPSAAEVARLVQKVPYLACLTLRQGPDGSWRPYPPPFPPITHTSNSRFDWKVLT